MLNLIRNTVSNFRLTKAKQDANNFLAAAGITGQVQSQAIYNLVNDLQTSGLWSKMKAVYPMVTDNYNQFYYSEDFSNANWYRINNTITTNSTTAPNGTLTADTFADNATNNIHQIAANYTLTGINGNNTASIYAKANTLNWICVTYFISGAYQKTFFDLQNGVVGTNASGNTATIENVGNGWYRCSITRNFNATGSFNVGFHTASADNVDSYAGSGQSLYIWGAQFQAGTPLAYQPIATTPSAFMASQMKCNLKDARDLDAAFRLTWSGGWTYSATGATPNGTNGYIDTNLVGNTNISQGNFGFGIYSRTNSSTVGAYGINGALHIYPKFTDGNTYYRIFGGGSAVSGQTTLGLIYGFNDSTSTSYGWFNGVKKQTTPSSNYTIPSTNLMFAGNVTGTGGYDSRQLSFGFASLYLNDSEAQLLNQIVEKYQVALSRGVQAAQSFYYNSAYSNEANTYLYSTQITGTTQVSAINTLINGLKANNLWTKMKAVYPFVTDKWNLLGYTEDFTNAAWSKGGGTTVTANTTTAPDGTTTADTVVLPNTGTIAQSLTNTANTQTIFSIYLRASANTTIKIGFFSPGTVVTCNVTTEWQRFTISHTYSGTAYPQIYNDTGATVTLFVWGAQAEYNSSATTYQAVLGANSYASNVAAQMKFNLVNPQDSDAAFRLAFSGGWTYSTNGAQPNGTNGYADTKLVPSTNLSQNNTHIASYIRNTSQGVLLGTDNAFRLWIAPNFNGINKYVEINSGSTTAPSATISSAIGLWVGNRIINTQSRLYNNNSLNYTATSTSAGLDTINIFLSARNTGVASNYSSSQVAFSSIGEGLSDAEVTLLNQLITEYQTTLSRNV